MSELPLLSEPRPAGRPRTGASGQPGSQPVAANAWLDQTDIADRETALRAQRGEFEEHPPHY